MVNSTIRLNLANSMPQIDEVDECFEVVIELTVKPKGLAASLIGIAKTDAPTPTDEEVKVMLDDRLTQKYL